MQILWISNKHCQLLTDRKKKDKKKNKENL